MLGKMYNNRIINSGKNVRRYNPVTQFENLKDTMLIRDRVYDALRREILSGGFAPGETLNILGLSKQMGVSCAPVREALNMLNKDGLVDLMPYKKASVAMGTDADYKAAFDLRLMLEPYALLQSIDMIPGSEIRAMELMLQEDCQQVESVPDFYASDNAFHQMLYHHTNSKLLTSTLDNIRTYTMRYFARRFDMVVEAKRKHYMDKTYDQIRTIRDEFREHYEILQAVKQRDGRRAAELLREHISLNSTYMGESNS